MTDHDATIEVNDGMAQTIAQRVLDSLGVEPSEVGYMTVSLTTEDGGQTFVQFKAAGEHAGQHARAMIGGIDFESHPATHIRVDLGRDDESADESGVSGAQDAAVEAEADGSGAELASIQQRRTAASDAEESKGWSRDAEDIGKTQPNVAEPQPVNRNTRAHELLYILDRWERDGSTDGWASAADLFSTVDHEFPTQEALGASLSVLFLEKALVDRTKESQEQGGVLNRYRLNADGADQLEELGKPDTFVSDD